MFWRIMESAKLLETDFSTADAEYPEIIQVGADMIIKYKDWQEQTIEVFFSDPVAYKWQMAIVLFDNERDDECYEILDSHWLVSHIEEGVISATAGYHHYKFNFNECGQFEILSPYFSVRKT